VTTNGTEVDRTANAQNEVMAVGSNSLSYDADGNTTTDDQGHTLVYDAWNRLVAVTSGSTVLAGYTYDAASRRISETHSGTTTDLYVNAADQVIGEVNSASGVTNFWDPMATDELTLRIVDTASGETQMYALTNANGDVAAVVDQSGAVQERYAYDPYGQVTVLTPSYASRSSSAIGWEYLHQGLRFDSVVDLYDNRARAYSPTLTRFLQNDPIVNPRI
jgi:RHS repeat-associated protein